MIALAKPDNRIMLDTVICGDALAVLRGMPDNSVDAIVTDPPAGIAFMGKEWDTFSPEYLEKMAERETKRKSLGPQEHNGVKKKRSSSAFGDPAHYAGSYDFSRKGRDAFVTFMTGIMTEALRVLKPGGHALVWALPRTSHWTALALEDAGFEIRDCVYHVFGSGFPKSLDISKAIDKMNGAEREVIGIDANSANRKGTTFHGAEYKGGWTTIAEGERNITAPATPEAQQWQGFGTALKPAVECWWLCRKPLAEPSIAANVLKYGTGGLNVDACRVGTSDKLVRPAIQRTKEEAIFPLGAGTQIEPQGRFPSHLLLSHSIWCVPTGTKRVRGSGGGWNGLGDTHRNAYSNQGWSPDGISRQNPDGYEQVDAYDCHESCPIRALDEQSGVRKSGGRTHYQGQPKHPGIKSATEWYSTDYHSEPSEGGCSRYFTNFPPDDFTPFQYCSKASRRERSQGLEESPVLMRLRDDLSPEIREYVACELAKIGGTF